MSSNSSSNANAIGSYLNEISAARIALIAMALTFTVIGVFLITYTIAKMKRLLNFTNILVLNLCWSGLLLNITGLFNVANDNVAAGTWSHGLAACQVLKPIIYIVSIVVAYSLVAISYSRFRIICQPLRPRPERHYAYYVIAGVWALGLIYGIPFGSFLTIIPFGGFYYCTFPNTISQATLRGYGIGLILIIFLVPFVCQAFFNIKIAVEMNRANSASRIFIDPEDDKLKNVRRQLTRMSVALVVVFFVTWLPYFILITIVTYNGLDLSIHNGDLADYYRRYRDYIIVRDFLLSLIYCSAFFNLIILYTFNPHFKASLKRVLGISRKRKVRVESEKSVHERSMSVVSYMMAGKIDLKY